MRLLLSIVFLAVIASCDTQKQATASSEVQVIRDTVVVVVEPSAPKDSLAVAFEKTPCFGRCPVFKIKVYKSGFAVYEGLNFAEKMGLYSYRFSREDLEIIYKMAEEIDYFNLEAEYNDPRVSDLPSIISKISINEKSHRVKARMGTPEELKDFHENLGIMLNERDWQPYSLR
ncbi:MAG: DUF6438 domain-containing protein [Bacteroidota bacterium]